MTPTYLSKIEREVFPPPAEQKIIEIARGLDESCDELLALAGKIAGDVRAVILERPSEFASLIRSLRFATREEIRALMSSVTERQIEMDSRD